MKALEVHTRIQLKNILFATDFSPASDVAVPYAFELAKHYGAKVYALHVRPPIVNPMTPPVTWKSLEEAASREAEQYKQDILKSFAGLQPEILINEGDLWSNIEAIMKETPIDLIVMGTRGRSGVARFVLGSTAERIFRQAPCPVLTVGPHAFPGSKPKRRILPHSVCHRFQPGINRCCTICNLASSGISGLFDAIACCRRTESE